MPNKFKIKLFFLIIFSILPLLSACEFKDIDKDIFVSMIAIDESDDPEKPYKVTLKLYVPTSSFKQSPEPKFIYLTKNGESLSEAIRILETHSDKEIEFGHTKLVVIGEGLIKKDGKGKEVLDFIVRRPDIQMISWIAVGRPSAEEVVKLVPASETAAFPALFNYFDDNGTESPYIVTTFLFDFRRRMVEDGIDAILPIIEITQNNSQFEIRKSFILSDKKKPYELSPLNTLIYNVLSMHANRADIIVNEEEHYFIARIDTIDSKYNVKVRNNQQLLININISLYGYISESKKTLDAKKLPFYNKLLEEETKKNTIDFIIEMTNAGYDPLGFGLKYKAQTLHNQRMSTEHWQKIYKDAKVNVTINTGLKSTGSIH